MIKKFFVGLLLAGVFGLLILGAVNRTIAKSEDSGPLALAESSNGGNRREELLAENGNIQAPLDGSGYGRGKESSAAGLGGGGRTETIPGDGLNLGLADAGVWEEPMTVNLDSATTDLWTVSNDSGFELGIEGRALSHILDHGFRAEVGDALVIVGFWEGDRFEIGAITNNNTQESLMIRDASGRPMWAGRGQGSRTP